MNHQDFINTCIFEQYQGLLFSDLSGPLTLTSKWDPHWQVIRVSGTTVFLRHQQFGKTKRVHRSKVKLVDPDMVWEEVAPRPHRKQQRGGPREVPVNIPVNPPQAIIPPRGDPLPMGNPLQAQELQLSVPDESLEMETDLPVEHPLLGSILRPPLWFYRK